MNAILYICHGSRVPAAREQAASFIRKCMDHHLAPIQEYCFLELAEPTIEQAFVNCINKGASQIIVMPVLLLSASHAKADIPNELARLSAIYPDTKVLYSEPIGVDANIVTPIMERIKETGELISPKSMALLVGRGSSDPDVKRDLTRIAGLLTELTEIKHVETCFLHAASPSLEEGLKSAGESGYEKVFIVPYLLFTGLLMKRLKKDISMHPYSRKFYLCGYLGYHPSIKDILIEKITALLNTDWDNDD